MRAGHRVSDRPVQSGEVRYLRWRTGDRPQKALVAHELWSDRETSGPGPWEGGHWCWTWTCPVMPLV